MRGSLVLLAALMACSDSSGPHQVPVLTTQLSTTSASIGGGVLVTLLASNPTDTTVRLAYETLAYAEFKLVGHANWQGGFAGGFTGVDDQVLAPGDTATLGEVGVGFYVPTANSESARAVTPTQEYITLEPGSYSVRACVDVPSSGAYICGNGTPFTLTQ
jgi:hypothetical protein